MTNDESLAALAAALKQAAAEFGHMGRIRHLHMLVQAGLGDVRIAPVTDGYPIEQWEAMEVRRFSYGLPAYGMIHDTVDNMTLTPKGQGALDRILDRFGQ